MSLKGAAQHCRGTKKAGNVAQGCRAALPGNDMGFLCRLRVLDPLIVAWIKSEESVKNLYTHCKDSLHFWNCCFRLKC